MHGDPSRESNVREILRRYFRRGVTIDFFFPPPTPRKIRLARSILRSYPVRARARTIYVAIGFTRFTIGYISQINKIIDKMKTAENTRRMMIEIAY